MALRSRIKQLIHYTNALIHALIRKTNLNRLVRGCADMVVLWTAAFQEACKAVTDAHW